MDKETKISLIMKTLTDYYIKNPEKIKKVLNILDQNDILSLRILDWFITNYSKKYRTTIDNNKTDVYMLYKLMLKSYSKSSFDPFSRKNKLIFYYKYDCDCGEDCKHYIETSCGQLSFFKWCFDNNILDYVVKNLNIIEKDMKDSLKEKINTKKRQPISVSAARSIKKQHVKYLLRFD